jgi:hypothetical protein
MSDTPALPEPDCGLGVHINTYSSDLMRNYAAECVRAALAAQAEAHAAELRKQQLMYSALNKAAPEGLIGQLERLTAERDALRADIESIVAASEMHPVHMEQAIGRARKKLAARAQGGTPT